MVDHQIISTSKLLAAFKFGIIPKSGNYVTFINKHRGATAEQGRDALHITV